MMKVFLKLREEGYTYIVHVCEKIHLHHLHSLMEGSFLLSNHANQPQQAHDRHRGLLMAAPCTLKSSLCKLAPLAVLYTIYLGRGLLQKESLGLVSLSVTALFPSIYLHYHQTWWVGLLSNSRSTELTVWFEVPFPTLGSHENTA